MRDVSTREVIHRVVDAAASSPEPDGKASAAEAGLRYIGDSAPGISRHRHGKTFMYRTPNGKPLKDADTLMRIKALVIPPAWTDVWICTSERGHLQAAGRDARKRKQYRYHSDFRAKRDESKYERMLKFVKVLPKIRRRVARDLRKPGLSREKVLAAVVKLLQTTLIRVGNETYAQENHSYGLTTIRNRHAKVSGSTIHFSFRGKSGVDHAIDFSDRRIAKIVRQCQDLPGEELFAFRDEDGKVHDIGSHDVNQYLHDIAGDEFTAKDFRTWAGTVMAAAALKEFEKFDSQTQAKKNIVRAIEAVASKLGNTKAVCRKCYIHPQILSSYLDGSLIDSLRQRASALEGELAHLNPEEAAVLVLLQRKLSAGKKTKQPAKNVALGARSGRAFKR